MASNLCNSGRPTVEELENNGGGSRGASLKSEKSHYYPSGGGSTRTDFELAILAFYADSCVT